MLGTARANLGDGALQAAGCKASHRVVDREADYPRHLHPRRALGDNDRRGLTFRVVVVTREQVGGGDPACDEEEKQEKSRPDERPRWWKLRILLFNNSPATPGHHEVIPDFAGR